MNSQKRSITCMKLRRWTGHVVFCLCVPLGLVIILLQAVLFLIIALLDGVCCVGEATLCWLWHDASWWRTFRQEWRATGAPLIGIMRSR